MGLVITGLLITAARVFVVPRLARAASPRSRFIMLRRVEDDCIEPFAYRDASAPRCLARRLARLPPDPADLPRDTRFHAASDAWRDKQEPDDSGGPERENRGGKRCGPASSGSFSRLK